MLTSPGFFFKEANLSIPDSGRGLRRLTWNGDFRKCVNSLLKGHGACVLRFNYLPSDEDCSQRIFLFPRGFGSNFQSMDVLNWLNAFPNMPEFLRVCSTSRLKTLWGKGEIARNDQFLLVPQWFLPVWKPPVIYIKFEIVVCKLFEFGQSKMCRLGKG